MTEGLLDIPAVTGSDDRVSSAIDSIIGPIMGIAFGIASGSGVKVRLEATYDDSNWEATATANDQDVLIEGNIAKEFKTSPVCRYRFVVSGGNTAQRNAVQVVWGRYYQSNYWDPKPVV